MCRASEGARHRVVIAGMPFEAQVARHVQRQERRAGGSRRRPGRDRRQRHIIDGQLLGRVKRLVAALGDNQRHRLADIAHLALGEERLRHKREGLAGHRIGIDIGEERL